MLVLAPSRKNLQMESCLNKVTCLEWQKNDGRRKIAAGFQDGKILN